MKVWSSLSWEAEGSRKLAQVSLDRVFEPYKDHPSTEFLSSSGPEYYHEYYQNTNHGLKKGQPWAEKWLVVVFQRLFLALSPQCPGF